MFLSYYVSYLLVDLMGLTAVNTLISNAYILIPVKLGVYAIFFMYSLDRYRSVLLDILGVLSANAASVALACFMLDVPFLSNILYFVIVFIFDGLIAVMVRYLCLLYTSRCV